MPNSRPDRQRGQTAQAAALWGLALALTAFILILWQVLSDGPLTVLDADVQAALAPWRRPEIVGVFSWVTLLGGGYLVAAFLLAVTPVLVLRRAWPEVSGLWLAVLGAGLSMLAVKALVGRPRPSPLEGIATTSWSFPSGSSVLAAALFVSLALLLLRHVPTKTWRAAMVVLGVVLAVALPSAVAFSRLVLSAHWLSDVVAGLCLGAAWALVGSLLAARLGGSRPHETPPDSSGNIS